MTEAENNFVPYDVLKEVRMPWGAHKGRSFGEIASDDKGLLYLDWLVGQMEQRCMDEDRQFFGALVQFLDNPAISRRVQAAVEKEEQVD
jgi:hypothetical protein